MVLEKWNGYFLMQNIYVKQCEIMQKINEKAQMTNFNKKFWNLFQVSSWGNPDLMEYLSQTMLNHAKKINEKAQKANLGQELRLGGSRIWWNIKCQTTSSQIESVSLITCTNLIFRSIKIKFPPNYVCCHIFLALLLIQSILTASKFVEKSWWAWSRRAHFSLA